MQPTLRNTSGWMHFSPWFINIFPFARARIKAAWPLQKASMEGFIQWLCRIDIERVEVENASRSRWWKEHSHGHALTTQHRLNGRVWEAPLSEEKRPILNEVETFSIPLDFLCHCESSHPLVWGLEQWESLPCTVAADVVEAFMKQVRCDVRPLCPLFCALLYSDDCIHTHACMHTCTLE